MTAGFLGTFPAGLTTGFQNIGAVQFGTTGAGSLGVFPAGLTTGTMNIGAVQLAASGGGGGGFNPFCAQNNYIYT